MEVNNYGRIYPEEKIGRFIKHRKSIRYHNKSYDDENNNKTSKKNSVEKFEKKVSKPFKP